MTFSKQLELVFHKDHARLVPSFKKDLAFVALGGYLYCPARVQLTARVSFETKDGVIHSKEASWTIQPEKWSKFGVHDIFPIEGLASIEGSLDGKIRIQSEDDRSSVDFFGVNMDVVDYYYGKDLWYRFSQKTRIYFPEIYYFESSKPFHVLPYQGAAVSNSNGRCLVLKSCNRCTRYLPIDVEHERNAISFSNHHRQARCNHASFATYRILQNSCEELPDFIARKVIGKAGQSTLSGGVNVPSIRTFYGYQLECRPCKKFVVNAPLNPKRSSTQHREDSLRRRALESLVNQLLGRDTIYNEWKAKGKDDFDEFIWNKFGRRCFHCHKEMRSSKYMDLDHTLPLSALWRLDETATCLCKTCNSEKRDKFPVEFYTSDELRALSRETGLDLKVLESKEINLQAVQKLRTSVVWFFDEFLKNPDYQKIRKGKRTADLICKAVQEAVDFSSLRFDLVNEYFKKTGEYPKTVTVSSG